MLPATINVQEPPELRDHTRIQDSALYLNTRARPWFAPPGQPRRAGVSSFGFGGANYHAVRSLGLYLLGLYLLGHCGANYRAVPAHAPLYSLTMVE